MSKFIQLYRDYYVNIEDNLVYIATSMGFECMNISFDEFIEQELEEDFRDLSEQLYERCSRLIEKTIETEEKFSVKVNLSKFNIVVANRVEAEVLDILVSLYPRGASREALLTCIRAELLSRNIRDESLVEKIFMKYIQHQNIRKSKELFSRKEVRDLVKMLVEQKLNCKAHVRDDGIIYISRMLTRRELREAVKHVKEAVREYLHVKVHFRIQYDKKFARVLREVF